MKINRIDSERLAILKFPLIVGVVFIHAYGVDLKFVGSEVNTQTIGFFAQFIQDIISQGIARLSVPMFFLLSGYFFFSGLKWSTSVYIVQIKKRFHSLFIPFIFWNLFVMFAYISIQELSLTKDILSGDKVKILALNSWQLLDTFFGISTKPMAYQFWFIRDLIVTIFASPIIYYIIKKLGLWPILMIMSLWLFNWWPIYIPSIDAVFFFSLGAYFGIKKLSLFKYDPNGVVILMIYIIIIIIDTLTKNLWFSVYVHNAGILFGLIGFLFLTSKMQKNSIVKQKLLQLSNYSFFVFAFHEPILLGLRKVSYKILLPVSDLLITTLYFVLPIIVIFFSIAIYLLLKKTIPKFLIVVTGGR